MKRVNFGITMPEYDLIIFGATGFTGKYVLETVVKTLKAGESFTYAVAGRSKGKLDSILKEISESTGKNCNQQQFCFLNNVRFSKIILGL